MDYKHILKHWNIIKPTNIKKMKSYNNKTCLIVNYNAKKYVLKEKDNKKRINCEYYLLSELINHNITVSIPVKTINNSIIKNINLSF
jgi:Ser/Thr protein kinase RdoA (MazF antagonist)